MGNLDPTQWIPPPPPPIQEQAQQALQKLNEVADQKIIGQSSLKDLAQVAAQAAVKNGFQFGMPGMATAALASRASQPEAPKFVKQDGKGFSIYEQGGKQFALLDRNGQKYAFESKTGDKEWGKDQGKALYDQVRDRAQIKHIKTDNEGFKIYQDKDGKEVATMKHEKFGELGYKKDANGKWQRDDKSYGEIEKGLADQKARTPKTIAEEALGALQSLPKELKGFKESAIKAGEARFEKEFAKDPAKAIVDARDRISKSSLLSESEKASKLEDLKSMEDMLKTSVVDNKEDRSKNPEAYAKKLEELKVQNEKFATKLAEFDNVAKQAAEIFGKDPSLQSVRLNNGSLLTRAELAKYNENKPYVDLYLSGKLDPNHNISQLHDAAKMTIEGLFKNDGMRQELSYRPQSMGGASLAIKVDPTSSTSVASK